MKSSAYKNKSGKSPPESNVDPEKFSNAASNYYQQQNQICSRMQSPNQNCMQQQVQTQQTRHLKQAQQQQPVLQIRQPGALAGQMYQIPSNGCSQNRAGCRGYSPTSCPYTDSSEQKQMLQQHQIYQHQYQQQMLEMQQQQMQQQQMQQQYAYNQSPNRGWSNMSAGVKGQGNRNAPGTHYAQQQVVQQMGYAQHQPNENLPKSQSTLHAAQYQQNVCKQKSQGGKPYCQHQRNTSPRSYQTNQAASVATNTTLHTKK